MEQADNEVCHACVRVSHSFTSVLAVLGSAPLPTSVEQEDLPLVARCFEHHHTRAAHLPRVSCPQIPNDASEQRGEKTFREGMRATSWRTWSREGETSGGRRLANHPATWAHFIILAFLSFLKKIIYF